MKNKIKVQNLEGQTEPFSRRKVYYSARNAGAGKELAEKIAQEVEKNIYPNIRTAEIFKEVKRLLKEKNFKASLKFDLKVAMKRLGPTGFPFEKYVKSIFDSQQFKTRINLNIKGKCCVFEVDFLATKEDIAYVGECKYRNLFEDSVDVNTALINHARFLDLKQGNYLKNFSNIAIKSILVTNAKFSSKAVRYAKCIGMNLWGWKYPQKQGLEKVIEENKLYPVTILPSLSKKAAEAFTLKHKMLASDVLSINFKRFAKQTGVSLKELEKLKQEAEILLAEE